MNKPIDPPTGAAVRPPTGDDDGVWPSGPPLLPGPPVEAAVPVLPLEPVDEDEEVPPPAPPPRKRQRSLLRTVIEWVAVVGGALLVALVIQATAFKTYYIPSTSMVPTLEVNDRVIVNRLSYRGSGTPHRGQIIVFDRPEAAPESDIEELIKRVIAVGGDTIEAKDGRVYVNDLPLEEEYLPDGTVTTDLPRQQVPEGAVFVMGDNRSFSSDSRVWGPVDTDLVVGRAIFRVWPLDRIGRL